MARRLSRVLTAAFAFVLVTAGAADATVLLDADYESADGTVFSGPGASRDCTVGKTGSCSIKIDPPCCSAGVDARTPVANGTMTGRTTVSFAYRGDGTDGDVDSNAMVTLDTGWVMLDVTGGWAPNTGVSLLSDGYPTVSNFTAWTAANTWYDATFTIDPATDTVTATTAGGTATTGIAPGASKILAVQFTGFRWSGFGYPMRYDAVRVDTAPPPNRAPVTTRLKPAPGDAMPADKQEFTVVVNDPDGDATDLTVDVFDAATGQTRETMHDTTMVPSGQQRTIKPSAPLPLGNYTWRAYARDSKGLLESAALAQPVTIAPSTFLQGTWVHLGDSYSSGEGAPNPTGGQWTTPWEPGTDQPQTNECHRSDQAYARVVWRQHARVVVPERMAFGACSAAVTKNLWRVRQWANEPFQFDRITPDTTLVTIGIGGNDADFAPILQRCIIGQDCAGNETIHARLDRRLARLNANAGSSVPAPDLEADDGLDDVIPYAEVFAELRRRAPNARVVVVGYPTFFPPNGYRYNGLPSRCENVHFNDQLWMNEGVARLNRIIEDRATQAGFEFADMEFAFLGHHLCSDDRWMNGIIEFSPQASWAHPNAAGHEKGEAPIFLDRLHNTAPASPCTPAAPGAPTVAVPTDTTLTATWAAPANCTVEYYKVFRDGVEPPITSPCFRPTASTCRDTGLLPDRTYSYTVSAVSAMRQYGIEGAKSAAGSGRTAFTPCTPNAPTGVTAGTPAGKSLTVSWTANSNGCPREHFLVTRSASQFGTYFDVPTTSPCWKPASPSCVDGNLQSSATYWYKVVEVSKSGHVSAPGGPASGTTAAPCYPAAPTGVTATTPTATSLRVAWTANHNGCQAVHFRVFRSASQTGVFDEVPTTSTCHQVTGSPCTDTGLTANTAYWYKVSEVSNTGHEGPQSTAISGASACTPTAPNQLTVGSPTSTSLTLSWARSSTTCQVHSYRVYRTPSSNVVWAEVPTTSGCYRKTTLTCTDGVGLDPSTSYSYRVREVSSTQTLSPYSTTVANYTAAPPCVPGAPTGLTVTGTANTSATLAWTAPTSACYVSYYRVVRATSATGTFTDVATTSGCYRKQPVTCTDTNGPAANTTYWYKVSQVSSTGHEGAQSAAVSATTTCAAAPPAGLSAGSPTTTSLAVDWSPAGTEPCTLAHWRVYRSDTEAGEYVEVPPASGCYRVAPSNCVDTGLYPGTTYWYKVTEVSTTGHESARSGAVSGATTPSCAPSPPASVTATSPTTSSLRVAWSPTAGANPCSTAYFRVTRSLTQTGQYDEVPSGSGCFRPASSSCVDTGLQAGVTYWYQVSEVTTVNTESGPSAPGSGTTSPPPCTPAAPTGVGVGSPTSSSLAVSWSRGASGCQPSYYRVLRAPAQSGPWNEVPTGSGCFQRGASPCVDGGLTASTTYWYAVAEVSSTGTTGPQSAAVSGTTSQAPCTPGAPSGIATSGAALASLNVSWTANPNGCQGSYFQVFRSTSQTGTFTEVAIGTGCYRVSTPSCTDTASLSAGTTYWYKVAQVSTTGHAGAQGGPASGTTASRPPNDAFAAATAVPATSWGTSQTTAYAGMESGEPGFSCQGSGGATVWYRFTPPESGLYQIDTVGSDYDTVLAVHTGSAVNGLSGVECNDDSGGATTSKVLVTLMAGTTYRIQVGGYTARTGNLQFNLWKSNTSLNPAGFTQCATEGGTCALSGTRDVAYGAHGVFVVKTGLTGSVSCSAAAFGKDPDPGWGKACFTIAAGGGGVPAGFSWCANEGGACSWTGSRDIVYGNTHGTYALLVGANSGTLPCRNSAFWDPNGSTAEACYLR